MAYANTLFNENFLEYASYVIKDRAIPHIDDGFKLGFQLAPKGGGYLFDFSEDGLRDVFAKFLAPRFRKYFFGPG